VTDGTAAGTTELTVAGASSSGVLSAITDPDLTVLPPSLDLPWQTDGTSIFFQNDSGEVVIWEMNGTTVIGGGSLGNPGPGWRVVGIGDFNGDGKSDILWRNDSGEVAIWEMNGTTVIGSGSLGNPGPSWHAVGTGDFNGDGKSDILWQNDSGEVDIWEMNGTTVIGGGSPGNPGPGWHLWAPAISTATAFPASCGRTTAARSISGR
jgi:hypothetical protein